MREPYDERAKVRPTHATIDLGALRHNLHVARNLASGVAICAVVKANAYGHGLVPVAQTLERAGADYLAVALVEEGLSLRKAGVGLPILVFGGSHTRGYGEMLRNELTPVVARRDQLAELAQAAVGAEAGFHLKVDTGMSRLGVQPHELATTLDAVREHSNLRLRGLMTHLANADLGDEATTHQQLGRFDACLEELQNRGVHPKVIHAANSAGLIAFPESHHTLVRPGLMLYGIDPLSPGRCADLRPVMSLETHPVDVKTLAPGARVSYGGRWTAEKESRIAVLPIGYGDGLPYALTASPRSDSPESLPHVLVRGTPAPYVGSICMDLCHVDVTHIPDVSVADTVTLLGTQGSRMISARTFADWLGTIPYEVVTQLGDRVHRTYTGNEV